MDEEAFQDIVCEHPDLIYTSKSREEVEAELNRRKVQLDSFSAFHDRKLKGPRFLTNFGPKSLDDALRTLSSRSTDKELRRVQSRLLACLDSPDICIYTPSGENVTFHLASLEYTTITMDGHRDWAATFHQLSDDPFVQDKCFLPMDIAYTLDSKAGLFAFLPLAWLATVASPDDMQFLLVWNLTTRKPNIIHTWLPQCDEKLSVDEHSEAPLPRDRRIGILPQTTQRLSIGSLSSVDGHSVLTVESDEGFTIHEAIRVGNNIEPLRPN